MVVGFRCAVCHTMVDIATPLAWRCPRATTRDPYHVLRLVETQRPPSVTLSARDAASTNPFVAFGPWCAWWAFAGAQGMSSSAREALAWEVAGEFRVTPFGRSRVLSESLGLDVWVKDETANLAGSHKGRHLASILLHLRAAEILGLLGQRRRLAIASCGNAAMAASTLAGRLEWPIDVYVPTWIADPVVRRLEELGATVHRCDRRSDDPPGDPAMLRFREAVQAGAIPFTVQGPENGYCLDGGRTIGWEIAAQARAEEFVVDRVMVQVGGGALAASVGAGLGCEVRLDTIQAEGCAPLEAAWSRAESFVDPEQHWPEVMQPWPEPSSAADGILDDETYDWVAVVEAMKVSGGSPVVAPESMIVAAHQLAWTAGFRASATGAAGLAGVLAERDRGDDLQQVVVVISGSGDSPLAPA